jgi:hypothetical protein
VVAEKQFTGVGSWFWCSRAYGAGARTVTVHVREGRYLLNKGAEINTANNLDWTPLFLATRHAHMNMITMLLERGAYTEVTLGKYTPLRMAC